MKPRPPQSRSRHLRGASSALLLALTFVMAPRQGLGQTILYWDPATAGVIDAGTAGIWNTTNSKDWNTTAAGTNANSTAWIQSGAPLVNAEIATVGSAASAFTITVESAIAVNNIAIGNIGTGTVTIAPNGGTLTITGGITSTRGTAVSISVPITLGAAQTFSSGSAVGGSLSITGAIANGGNLLTLDGANAITMDGVVSGTGGITLAGSGTTTLGGSNTYTGATTISNGTLVASSLASGGSLGSATSAVNLGSAATAGTLQYTGDTATYTRGFVLGTAGGALNVSTAGQTLTVATGTITGTGTLSVTGAGNTTISSVMSQSGGLSKSNNGTLTLSGTNTFSGATTITGGVLSIAADTALGTAPGTATAGHLTLNGGTLGTTSTFTLGSTRGISLGASGGTFSVASATTLTYGGIAAGTGALTKTSAGTLVLTGTNSYTGTTTISAGTLQLGNGTTDGSITSSASIANSGTLAFNLIGSQTQSNVISGTGALTKSGAGTLTLSGTNTYTGATTISGGKISVATIGNGGVAGNLGQATNAATNLVFAGGTLGYTGSTASTNRSFTINAGSTATLEVDSVAANLTVTGASTATTGAFTKTGEGTLTLGGANLHTGTTTVNAGTLALTTGGTLGNGSNVVVSADGTTGTTATLDLNGINATIGSLTLGGAGAGGPKTNTVTTGAGTLTLGGNVLYNGDQGNQANGASISGNLALGGTNRTITTNGTATLTIDAAISGSNVGLTKAGSGPLVLGGSNTYTGTTAINAGTLELGSANALGGNGNLSFGGGTLRYTADNTSDLSNRLTASSGTISLDTNGQNVTWASNLGSGNSGGLAKSGTGTLTLSGTNSYTGTTTLNAGTLALASDSAIGSGALTLNGGTLTPSGSARTISNASSLTGNTTLDAGSLGLIHSGNINATTPGNDTLTLTGSATTSALTGTLSDTASSLEIVKSGSGTWTISGTNTHNGVTEVNAGTLRLTNASALGVRNGTDTLTLGGLALDSRTLELAADTATTFGPSSGYGTTITQNATIVADRASAGAGVTQQLGTLTMGAQTLTLSKGANVSSGTAGLTFGGLATFSGNPTFAVDSGTALELAGGIDGAVNLTKSGAGTLTLSGTSGHANTSVNAGTLNINFNTALGTSAGTLTLASGVTLDNTSGNSVTVLNPKSISVGSTVNFTGTNNLNLGPGALTLAQDTTFHVAGGTLTLGGNVAGNFNLTKTGAGILDLAGLGLSGSTAYAGSTVVSAGELHLSGSSALGGGATKTLTVAPGAVVRVGPSGSLGGVQVVLQSDTGSNPRPSGLVVYSTLTTANKDYTGIGSLGADNASIDGIHTIKTGATLTATGDFFGPTPASATSGRIVIEGGAKLQAASTFTIDSKKGIELGSGSVTLESNQNVQMLLPSVLSGSGALIKDGLGNVRLTNTNTYTGGTTVNLGTLGITSDAALGAVSGAVTLNNDASLVAAQTLSGATVTGTTLDSSRTLRVGNGATVNLDAQTGLFLAYSGVIGEVDPGGTAGNLRFGTAGPRTGTVTLNGANTYKGSSTLRAGTLEVAILADGGTASGIGSSSNAAANLVFDGGKLKYTGAGSTSTDRLFTLGIGGGTIDTDVRTVTFSNSGQMALAAAAGTRTLTLTGSTGGIGSLATAIGNYTADDITHVTKTGTGTWTLSGENTYTGLTSINGGVLKISSAANLGATVNNSGLSFNGGTLQTTAALSSSHPVNLAGSGAVDTNGNAVTMSGAFGGSGAFTKTGNGTLTLSSASNSFAGGITVSAGTLKADGSGSLGTGAGATNISLAAGTTLEIAGSGADAGTSGNIYHTISGEGGLTRTFTSGATIGISLAGTQANTYTGLTEVASGTLRLQKSDNVSAFGGNAKASGGSLILRATENIPDAATVTITGGGLEWAPSELADNTETISILANSGGTVQTYGNTLVVGTFQASSATSANINRSQAGAGANDGTKQGTIQIGAGGLQFSGTASPTITVQSVPSGNVNRLVLGGNVDVTVGSGTAKISSSGVEALSGVIDLNAGTRTFTVANGTGATDLEISAKISNGKLVKAGAGTLAVTSASDYSGGTDIRAGELAISHASALGSGTITLGQASTSTAMLVWNGNSAATVSNAITVAGSAANEMSMISNQGGGLLTLSGNITNTGQMLCLSGGTNGILVSGTISNISEVHTAGKVNLGSNLTNGGTATVLVGTTEGSATLEVERLSGDKTIKGGNDTETSLFKVSTPSATTDTFTGAIGGDNLADKKVSFTKAGDGTFVMSGNKANKHIGGTNVEAGTLRLSKTGAIAIPDTLAITGGTVEVAGSGQFNATSSAITLTGGTLTATGTGLTNSFGTLTNSAGTFSTGANTWTGTGNTITWSGTSTNTVSASGTLEDNHIVIDNTGGTNTVEASGTLRLLAPNGAPDGLSITGATLNLASGASSSGKLELNGSLTASGTSAITTGADATKGTIDLNTGTRDFSVASGGTLTVGAVVTNGALTKSGTGTLALNGVNTYTGATTINAGVLSVGGSLASAITVGNGGTLKGTGTIAGGSATVIQNGGIHAPGNSPGLQTFSSGLTYNSGSVFEWELISNLDGDVADAGDTGTRGTTYDAVDVTGTLTINSGAIFRIVLNGTGSTVDFANAFWSTPHITQTWNNIFTFTSRVGSFSTIEVVGGPENLSSYGSFSISGTNLTWSAVPEPSNALVGLLVAAGLLRRRRPERAA